MTQTTKFLPCPFCASENVSLSTCGYASSDSEKGRYVECEDCGANTHAVRLNASVTQEDADVEAAHKWNMRNYP